jgi:hypothetical protein
MTGNKPVILLRIHGPSADSLEPDFPGLDLRSVAVSPTMVDQASAPDSFKADPFASSTTVHRLHVHSDGSTSNVPIDNLFPFNINGVQLVQTNLNLNLLNLLTATFVLTANNPADSFAKPLRGPLLRQPQSTICIDLNSSTIGIDLNSSINGTELNSSINGIELKPSIYGSDLNSSINGIELKPSINGIDLNSSINAIVFDSSTNGADLNSLIGLNGFKNEPNLPTAAFALTAINPADFFTQPPHKMTNDINLEPLRPDSTTTPSEPIPTTTL